MAWFREVEVDSYLYQITENQADIILSLAYNDAAERVRSFHYRYDIENTLKTAKAQRAAASMINMGLMVIRTLMTVFSRIGEFRRQENS